MPLAARSFRLGIDIRPGPLRHGRIRQAFGDPEMPPRAQLVSVAYAFRPGTVAGATGGTITGDVAIQSDLDVDGDDLTEWQDQFGTSSATMAVAVSVTSEPATTVA